jgi:hypothetical protein
LLCGEAGVKSAHAMDYSYRVYEDRYLTVDAVGEITADEGYRFADWLDHLPRRISGLLDNGGAAFVFDSPGGIILGGIALGVIIERFHFSTGVSEGGVCASACTLAWAAGVHKSVAADSRIGVHNAAVNGHGGHSAYDRLSGRDGTTAMATWLYNHGAPDNVVNKALDTPADDIYWLTLDDLQAWNARIIPHAPAAKPVASEPEPAPKFANASAPNRSEDPVEIAAEYCHLHPGAPFCSKSAPKPSPPQQAPSYDGGFSVPLRTDNSGLHMKVKLGPMVYDMIVDTGATIGAVTATIAESLVASGLADWGQERQGRTVIVHSVQVGGRTANNVRFGITENNNAVMLLGINTLSRFGAFTVDLANSRLRFN